MDSESEQFRHTGTRGLDDSDSLHHDGDCTCCQTQSQTMTEFGAKSADQTDELEVENQRGSAVVNRSCSQCGESVSVPNKFSKRQLRSCKNAALLCKSCQAQAGDCNAASEKGPGPGDSDSESVDLELVDLRLPSLTESGDDEEVARILKATAVTAFRAPQSKLRPASVQYCKLLWGGSASLSDHDRQVKELLVEGEEIECELGLHHYFSTDPPGPDSEPSPRL